MNSKINGHHSHHSQTSVGKNAVFLIHSRDQQDIDQRFKLSKFFPASWTDFTLSRLPGRMGLTLCDQVKLPNGAMLYLLGVLLKPHQIISDKRSVVAAARSRILRAARFAQSRLDAGVIGLGALTVSATNGGRWLVEQPGITARITHGDAFATVIALEGIEKVLLMTGLKKPLIAVIGAYGIIGSAVCRSLAAQHDLLMIGRSPTKLEKLRHQLGDRVRASGDIHSIRLADVVVSATSNPGPFIQSQTLKPHAVIYDIAQPSSIDPKLLNERPDLICIDGSLAKTPGVKVKFDMRTGRDATFACLAETVLKTLEGIDGHHVGEIDLDYIDQIRAIGQKHRFKHADFTEFGNVVCAERFQASFCGRKRLGS